ncbi:outer membrane porin GjpA [Mycobacterium sp. CVI_P3]|uniref:Outer membrane porin GjpA n=1 Tax=Mycobacterium pinniadriaticum TaxID=2994102 RepID=A0ABT3SIX2_9MYCO|nr:outer membrane porin GjpA [Mycobacterium pinniadriaticum]MCX2933058.1 outer membrane porin GjpA [Mycobacterium pinniadriaticum]MCX2939480.1 outer membrane porin GjpA [Mycobacterium pinniadriaticum]
MAVVGASAIAISPVATPPPDVRAEAMNLAAASTDWADVFTTARENATALFNSWLEAPVPILQQILANQAEYVTELPDIAGILAQMQANFQAAVDTPLAPDPSTLDTTHRTFYELLPAIEQLPGIPDLLQLSISPTGKQLLALSTTTLSGVLVGLAGPVLGPLLVLASSLRSINSDLAAATPDVTSAMNTLADIPAAMTDAFLNGGQHVDLTALVEAVGPSIGVTFPDGVQVGIALGGLLSPGGSAFNALDFAYDNNLLGVLHIHVPLATGTAVGPFGAMMEFGRSIATAIGWEDPSSASAAAQSSSTQSLAAVNEVPRSVQSSGPASSARIRSVNVHKTVRRTAGFRPVDVTARRTVGHRDQPNSAAARSERAAKSGGQGRSARPAARSAAS